MTFWVAGAAVVAGVGGAVISSNATKKAAGVAGKSADATIAENQRQFNTVRQDTAGQRFTGDSALNLLDRLYGYGTPSKPLSFDEWSAQNPVAAPAPGKKHHGGLFGGGVLGSLLAPSPKNMLKGGYDPAGAVYSAVKDGQSGGLPAGTDPQAAYQQYLQGFQPTAVGAGKPDMSAFFTSPDYQFNLDQGQQAIDRSAAARGGLLSGGAEKAGIRYASGLASGQYGSFVDRLLQQAGLGSTGIGASAAAGANATANIGNANLNKGNAQASAYLQNGQNINNALNGTTSNLLLMKYLGTG